MAELNIAAQLLGWPGPHQERLQEADEAGAIHLPNREEAKTKQISNIHSRYAAVQMPAQGGSDVDCPRASTFTWVNMGLAYAKYFHHILDLATKLASHQW